MQANGSSSARTSVVGRTPPRCQSATSHQEPVRALRCLSASPRRRHPGATDPLTEVSVAHAEPPERTQTPPPQSDSAPAGQLGALKQELMDQWDSLAQQVGAVKRELMATRTAHSTVLAEETTTVRREAMEAVREEREERLGEIAELRSLVSAIQEFVVSRLHEDTNSSQRNFQAETNGTQQPAPGSQALEEVMARCEQAALQLEEERTSQRSVNAELCGLMEQRAEQSKKALEESTALSREAIRVAREEHNARVTDMKEVRALVAALPEKWQLKRIDEIMGKHGTLYQQLAEEHAERCARDAELHSRMGREIGDLSRQLSDQRSMIEGEIGEFGRWLGEQQAMLEKSFQRELGDLRSMIDSQMQPDLSAATGQLFARSDCNRTSLSKVEELPFESSEAQTSLPSDKVDGQHAKQESYGSPEVEAQRLSEQLKRQVSNLQSILQDEWTPEVTNITGDSSLLHDSLTQCLEAHRIELRKDVEARIEANATTLRNEMQTCVAQMVEAVEALQQHHGRASVCTSSQKETKATSSDMN